MSWESRYDAWRLAPPAYCEQPNPPREEATGDPDQCYQCGEPIAADEPRIVDDERGLVFCTRFCVDNWEEGEAERLQGEEWEAEEDR